MRDDEQHWFTHVDEGLLYLHTRAAITLFDDLLHRAFGERLADHLPLRVLPVGTEPPQDFQTLVDREHARVAELLKPHRRARAQARARLRSLLAIEAHVHPDARVSVTDVNRVEKGVRAGKSREQVFPRLGRVAAAVSGEGLSVEVRFVKHGGMPVRLVKDEDAVGAAARRRGRDSPATTPQGPEPRPPEGSRRAGRALRPSGCSGSSRWPARPAR